MRHILLNHPGIIFAVFTMYWYRPTLMELNLYVEEKLATDFNNEFLPFPHPCLFECDCSPQEHVRTLGHQQVLLIRNAVQSLEFELCWKKCVHGDRSWCYTA